MYRLTCNDRGPSPETVSGSPYRPVPDQDRIQGGLTVVQGRLSSGLFVYDFGRTRWRECGVPEDPWLAERSPCTTSNLEPLTLTSLSYTTYLCSDGSCRTSDLFLFRSPRSLVVDEVSVKPFSDPYLFIIFYISLLTVDNDNDGGTTVRWEVETTGVLVVVKTSTDVSFSRQKTLQWSPPNTL